jgi:type I restriction enzyme S subunit
MRKGWTDTTLDDVAIVVNGSTPSTKESEYWGGDIPWITTTELTACDGGYVSSSIRKITSAAIQSGGARVVRSGATLLGTTATIGTAALTLVDTSFNQQISGLLPKSEKVLDEFIFLWARGNRLQLDDLSAGTSFKRISTANLRNLRFVLPPLAEQRRFVDVVSSVDAYIAALKQQADSARKARNAMLYELLSAGGDDWTESTLGDVAEWFSGGTPKAGKPEFYENGTIPWVVIADMMKTEIFDTASKITKAGLTEIGGRVAPKDSVLISMYATVGRPGFAHIPVATNQAIAWSVPNKKMIQPRFLLLVAQFLESEISSMARGATQRNINRAMLKEFSFNLPPLDEQKRIVEIVSSMDDVIQTTELAVVDAKNLRLGLLSALLSGEHEIPAAYDSLLGAA